MMLVLAVAALNDEDCEEALAMEEIVRGQHRASHMGVR